MATVNPYQAPAAAVADAGGEIQPVRPFSISGRIGRARYIAYGFALYLVFAFAGGILAGGLGPAGMGLWAIFWIVLVVLASMLTIQRCHDFNMSGWLAALMLVPFVNLMFLFIPGTDGPNRFGVPTPPNGVAVLVVAWLIPVVFVGGIVAAIAIPAYQDYAKRAGQVQKR